MLHISPRARRFSLAESLASPRELPSRIFIRIAMRGALAQKRARFADIHSRRIVLTISFMSEVKDRLACLKSIFANIGRRRTCRGHVIMTRSHDGRTRHRGRHGPQATCMATRLTEMQRRSCRDAAKMMHISPTPHERTQRLARTSQEGPQAWASIMNRGSRRAITDGGIIEWAGAAFQRQSGRFLSMPFRCDVSVSSASGWSSTTLRAAGMG